LGNSIEERDTDHRGRAARDQDGADVGAPSDDQELRALHREVAELRRADEILKTASAFFAEAELDGLLK